MEAKTVKNSQTTITELMIPPTQILAEKYMEVFYYPSWIRQPMLAQVSMRVTIV